jgi:hypothetical protein
VLSIIELNTRTLDSGIPGVSPTHMLLLFLMMYAVAMIPFAFLYLSLRDKKVRVIESTKPFSKMVAWVHAHRHPALLHH